MSYVNQVLLTNNQAITNYDLSKVFVLNNRFLFGTYVNSGYTPITLTQGTIMGRISANGQLVPCASTNSDGSQYPVGILAQTYIIQAGASITLMYCLQGDVAEEEIGFYNGTDTLDTVLTSTGRRYRDLVASMTAGIILKPGTDLTDYDNQ